MGLLLRYRHGRESLEKELWLLQMFAESLSDVLWGTDKIGDDGMIKEWREDQATRRAYHRALQVLVAIASTLVGVEAVMNIVHLAKHFN